MMKQCYFIIIVVISIAFGCKTNKAPYIKYELLSGDTVDVKFKAFDSVGNLERIYYKKDSLMHGLEQEFYSTGVKKVEGNWYQGMQSGWFKYYDENGELQTLRQYIKINDSANWTKDAAYLNQVIRFDNNGDTIKEGSFFMRLYTTGDTVEYGAGHSFKVVLATSLYKEMHIVLCDYDEQYNLLPNAICDTFGVENYQRAFSPKKYNLGENVILGKIVNFENYLDSFGKSKSIMATIYFNDKFYVKS